MPAPNVAERPSPTALGERAEKLAVSATIKEAARSSLSDQPINPEEFEAWMARLEPFEAAPLLAIAVSGGADSLALTLLADEWARARGGSVIGLTVDHGLRDASNDEAHLVGQWLSGRRIEHHCLSWRGEKPKSGIQHQARKARYRLLADWCRERGCLHLLSAHHLRDQAETIQMRRNRQSGAAGLAGMSPIREREGFRLLRPLLGVENTRLIASLRAMGQTWIEDPSNNDPAFARTHLRRENLDVPALTALGLGHGEKRALRDQRIAMALVQHVVIDPAGFVMMDAKNFASLPEELSRDLLSRVLLTIGGRAYPPRGDSLSRLLHDLRGSSLPAARTLAHCLIAKQGRHWFVLRETVTTRAMRLEPGRWQRWDDRFALRMTMKKQGFSVQNLGHASRQAENTLRQKGQKRQLPALVKQTLPSLWEDRRFGEDRRLVAVPHLGLFDDGIMPGDIDLQFCPSTALAQAPFTPHMTP